MILLRRGSEGPYVSLLQSTLNKLGYNAGTVDGDFGPKTESAVKRFQRAAGLDVDGIVGDKTWAALMPYINGYIDYTVKQGDTFFLLAKRYGTTVNAIETANPSVDAQNLQPGMKLVIPLNMSVVPTDVPYGFPLLELNIAALKTRYPFLEIGKAGVSEMGKELPYIRIGTGSKEVFYNASHHANEWITSVLLMKFIENFCRSYTENCNISDRAACYIYENTSLYIMPMVNPDGVDLVTGYLDRGSSEFAAALAISKKYPSIPFPSGWKANIKGTDLNLNYPAEWEQAKTIKFEQGYTSPAPRDFVGTAPFSAAEARSVGEFTKKHSFTLTLSYHTQGEIIYWKFLNYFVPDSYEIAVNFSAVSGYSVELTPYESGYAGYKDWFIQEYRLPGYTIEAGKGVNPLPLSQFADIYRDNIGILTLAAVQ